jgi:hypothetical protein
MMSAKLMSSTKSNKKSKLIIKVIAKVVLEGFMVVGQPRTRSANKRTIAMSKTHGRKLEFLMKRPQFLIKSTTPILKGSRWHPSNNSKSQPSLERTASTLTKCLRSMA